MKKLTLSYDSGWGDSCYQYTLSIDAYGLARWQGCGVIDTAHKTWRLYKAFVEEISGLVADLKAQPSDIGAVVLDAPRLYLKVEFLDGDIFEGAYCYPDGSAPPWLECAELIKHIAQVNELIRPLWRFLADQALCLSAEDLKCLVESIKNAGSPGFLE